MQPAAKHDLKITGTNMEQQTADNTDACGDACGDAGSHDVDLTTQPAFLSDPVVGYKYEHRRRHRDRWSAKWRGQLAMLGVLWSFSSFSFLPLDQASITISFTIAVFIMTMLIGIPLFFIEAGIGQLTDGSPVIAMRELCPALGGVGIMVTMHAAVLTFYYSMCCTWAAYYLFQLFVDRLFYAPQRANGQQFSLHSANESALHAGSDSLYERNSSQSVRWSIEKCQHDFSTVKCLELDHPADLANNFTRCTAEWEHALLEADYMHDTDISAGNYSAIMENSRSCISSGEEFFVQGILNGADMEDWIGIPHYPLVITVGLVWLLAFFCCYRSVHSVQWASYIGVILPAILLTVLSVRCLLIPLPHWSMHFRLADEITKRPDDKLWHSYIWLRAGEFVVFTLLFGTGDLVTYASYMRHKRHKLVQAALVLPPVHFVICIVGNMCMCTLINSLVVVEGSTALTHLRSSVFHVFDWGPIGMFFITIPMALVKLEAPLFWLALFYTMAFCVSGSTLYAAIDSVTASVMDEWPRLAERFEWQITAVTCFVGFAVCVVFFTTPAGLHWHTMLHHCLGWTTIIVVFLTCCIVFLYGTRRFCYGLARSVHNTANEFRRARSAYWFFQYFRVGSILAAAYIVIMTIWYTSHAWHIQYYGGGTLYPEWAEVMNYVLYAILVSPVVIYPFFHVIYYRKKLACFTSVQSYLRAMLRPVHVFHYREVKKVSQKAPKQATMASLAAAAVDNDSSSSSSSDDDANVSSKKRNNNNVEMRRMIGSGVARSNDDDAGSRKEAQGSVTYKRPLLTPSSNGGE